VKQTAKLSSKYQASIPRGVREALGLHPGDRLVFEVDGQKVTLRRYPTLEELAGSVQIPPEMRNMSWSEIREHAWTSPAYQPAPSRGTATATARRTKRR
jgi:AbrB family looped-hinge helix DNA binding protein